MIGVVLLILGLIVVVVIITIVVIVVIKKINNNTTTENNDKHNNTTDTTDEVDIVIDLPTYSFDSSGNLKFNQDATLETLTTSMTTLLKENQMYKYITTIDYSNIKSGVMSSSNSFSLKNLYKDCSALTSITFGDNFNTTNATNMSGMFSNCSALETIEISSFDTSNITDMSSMFYNCNLLTELDLSGFNTSNVTDMSYMFNNCSSLTTLDLSKFDTNKVSNMSSMFNNCSSLTYLNITSFSIDTSLISTDNTEMFKNMFSKVGSKTKTQMWLLYVNKSFASTLISYKGINNTDNIAYDDDVDNILFTCYGDNIIALGDINIKWELNNNTLTFTSGASRYVLSKPIKELLSDVYTTIKEIDYTYISSTVMTEDTNYFSLTYLYSGCISLENINFGDNFNTSKVNDMSGMFNNCSSLKDLDISKFDASNVTDMSYMFSGCSALTELDLSEFNTSNVENMSGMFSNCSSLTSITFGDNFNTTFVTDMSYMFYNCSSLTDLDISKFNTSKVTDMRSMFEGCEKIEMIYFSTSFVISNLTDDSIKNMFSNVGVNNEVDDNDDNDDEGDNTEGDNTEVDNSNTTTQAHVFILYDIPSSFYESFNYNKWYLLMGITGYTRGYKDNSLYIICTCDKQ